MTVKEYGFPEVNIKKERKYGTGNVLLIITTTIVFLLFCFELFPLTEVIDVGDNKPIQKIGFTMFLSFFCTLGLSLIVGGLICIVESIMYRLQVVHRFKVKTLNEDDGLVPTSKVYVIKNKNVITERTIAFILDKEGEKLYYLCKEYRYAFTDIFNMLDYINKKAIVEYKEDQIFKTKEQAKKKIADDLREEACRVEAEMNKKANDLLDKANKLLS